MQGDGNAASGKTRRDEPARDSSAVVGNGTVAGGATDGLQANQNSPGSDARMPELGMLSVILCFRDHEVEGEYLAEVAAWRWPHLLLIFFFDICIWILRSGWMFLDSWHDIPSMQLRLRNVAPQLVNVVGIHSFLGVMNWRSRRKGERAARQEEVMLASLTSVAITFLLLTLTPDNTDDYVYATFFIICCASFLKIRWWLAMLTLSVPSALAQVWQVQSAPEKSVLTSTARTHIVVAWCVGGFMAWLAESYRRRTYAGLLMAKYAHMKEMQETHARLVAQEQLAEAVAQAAQRKMVVMREKAANEAKSEFMSLMCHEVRTPLNGCLASAEMLLETPLLDEQRDLTNTIRISGSILLSTVSNFLDFFKVQAGKKLDIVRTPFRLMDLIGDVHCIVHAMLGPNSKVTLLDPQIDVRPEFIVGDPDRLKGVLLNLYSNAAKFTRSGFICLRVRQCDVASLKGRDLINPAASYHQCFEGMRRHTAALEHAGYPVTPPFVSSAGDLQSWWHPFVFPASDVTNELGGLGEPSEVSAAASPFAAYSQNASSSIVRRRSRLINEVTGSSRAASGESALRAVDWRQWHSVGSQGLPQAKAPSMDGTTGPVSRTLINGASQVIVVEVVDTGVGVSKAGMDMLFRQFSQGSDYDMSKPRQFGGTGLGLSICSRQMEVLGGNIGATSCSGHGSIFWITFPLVKPQKKTKGMANAVSWPHLADHRGGPAVVVPPSTRPFSKSLPERAASSELSSYPPRLPPRQGDAPPAVSRTTPSPTGTLHSESMMRNSMCESSAKASDLSRSSNGARHAADRWPEQPDALGARPQSDWPRSFQGQQQQGQGQQGPAFQDYRVGPLGLAGEGHPDAYEADNRPVSHGHAPWGDRFYGRQLSAPWSRSVHSEPPPATAGHHHAPPQADQYLRLHRGLPHGLPHYAPPPPLYGQLAGSPYPPPPPRYAAGCPIGQTTSVPAGHFSDYDPPLEQLSYSAAPQALSASQSALPTAAALARREAHRQATAAAAAAAAAVATVSSDASTSRTVRSRVDAPSSMAMEYRHSLSALLPGQRAAPSPTRLLPRLHSDVGSDAPAHLRPPQAELPADELAAPRDDASSSAASHAGYSLHGGVVHPGMPPYAPYYPVHPQAPLHAGALPPQTAIDPYIQFIAHTLNASMQRLPPPPFPYGAYASVLPQPGVPPHPAADGLYAYPPYASPYPPPPAHMPFIPERAASASGHSSSRHKSSPSRRRATGSSSSGAVSARRPRDDDALAPRVRTAPARPSGRGGESPGADDGLAGPAIAGIVTALPGGVAHAADAFEARRGPPDACDASSLANESDLYKSRSRSTENSSAADAGAEAGRSPPPKTSTSSISSGTFSITAAVNREALALQPEDSRRASATFSITAATNREAMTLPPESPPRAAGSHLAAERWVVASVASLQLPGRDEDVATALPPFASTAPSHRSNEAAAAALQAGSLFAMRDAAPAPMFRDVAPWVAAASAEVEAADASPEGAPVATPPPAAAPPVDVVGEPSGLSRGKLPPPPPRSGGGGGSDGGPRAASSDAVPSASPSTGEPAGASTDELLRSGLGSDGGSSSRSTGGAARSDRCAASAAARRSAASSRTSAALNRIGLVPLQPEGGGEHDGDWQRRSVAGSLRRQTSSRFSLTSARRASISSQLSSNGDNARISGSPMLAGSSDRTFLPSGGSPPDIIQGVRVLLAEDNLINQMVARKMLTSLGAVVTVAADGVEAVKKVTNTFQGDDGTCAFDLVLMDMAMPQKDGVEATRAIRGLGCKVPIVAMTASVSDRDQEACKDAGMDGFLSKPVLKDRLARSLVNALSKRTWFDDSTTSA